MILIVNYCVKMRSFESICHTNTHKTNRSEKKKSQRVPTTTTRLSVDAPQADCQLPRATHIIGEKFFSFSGACSCAAGAILPVFPLAHPLDAITMGLTPHYVTTPMAKAVAIFLSARCFWNSSVKLIINIIIIKQY